MLNVLCVDSMLKHDQSPKSVLVAYSQSESKLGGMYLVPGDVADTLAVGGRVHGRARTEKLRRASRPVAGEPATTPSGRVEACNGRRVLVSSPTYVLA